MGNTTPDPSDAGAQHGHSNRASDGAKTTDGGAPTVTERGDDRKPGIDRLGQRIVHLLLVFVPGILILGLLLEGTALPGFGMRTAAALVGLMFTVVGLLAVVVILLRSFRNSRQSELSEFLSYKD